MHNIFEKIISVFPILSLDLTYLYKKDKIFELSTKRYWKIIIRCVPLVLWIVSDIIFDIIKIDHTQFEKLGLWIGSILFVAAILYIFLWVMSILIFWVSKNK